MIPIVASLLGTLAQNGLGLCHLRFKQRAKKLLKTHWA